MTDEPKKLFKIALFGATGAVGGYYLNKALAAGHHVTAIVRSASKLEKHPALTIIEGDVTNADQIAAVLKDIDVVVSCLGNVKKVMIMEKSADAILTAAARQDTPPRCLFVSSIGCGGSSWLIKQILSMIGGWKFFGDYDKAHARIVRDTSVPFMLIRPAALVERPGNGKFRTFTSNGTFARPIAKEDVAEFLMEATTSTKWDGGTGFNLAGIK